MSLLLFPASTHLETWATAQRCHRPKGGHVCLVTDSEIRTLRSHTSAVGTGLKCTSALGSQSCHQHHRHHPPGPPRCPSPLRPTPFLTPSFPEFMFPFLVLVKSVSNYDPDEAVETQADPALH